MNILSLFDGISCGRLALDKCDIKIDNYIACEIDKYAIKVSKNNYPDIIHLGDIKNINYTKLPKIDLIIGGPPCQSFSNSGNKKGFEGSGKLVYNFINSIQECSPKYFMMENVVMKKEWVDIISNLLGVTPIKINSNSFLPHERKRLFWCNFSINSIDINLNWFNDNYLVNKKLGIPLLISSGRGLQELLDSGETDRETSFCITSNYYKGASLKAYWKSRHQIVYNEDGSTRKLNVIECERLQGLPEGYTEGVSNRQRYKLIGNSWTIPVIEHILKSIR